MAMAACGEDEFGNLFADIHVKDVHALRGIGSLHWSLEDETEASTDTAPKDAVPERLPIASVDGCYANGTTAQAELDACALKKDNQAECGNISKNGTNFALHSNDVETDSDDDLRIVLNPLQKSVNESSADESEDGEDFVVLTGNEVASGQEWREDSTMPTEDSAQAKVDAGEKLGISSDRQVQNNKNSGVHPRICYGGQAFRRHYRYVRGNGVGRVGAISTGNARAANCQSSSTKPKRIGGGGGFTNFHRIGGSGAARGFSSGPEYILPFNKTVFDVDLDAFKEKPWRRSNVDASDYFNFELDESSWKNYCKQLAQFCLEVTTQSKISVYEGGRIGQPTARDTQAGGGSVGLRSSADVQGQQFRESDAIFLIDVKEDNISQSCSEGHQADVGDACKVLDSGGLSINIDSENKAEKEQPLVERRTRTSQKRSTAILREFSANVQQESGSAAVFSRAKTPSPATPPERLPIRGKRETMSCGRSRSSSSLNDGLQVRQGDCNSGALHKRKEIMQLAGHNKTSWGGQSSNAASSKPIRENHSIRTDLKRASAHAIAAQMSKKRRLDSNQANHGCRYASLLIRKLSRVRASKAISEPQVGAEIIQQGKHSSINTTVGLPNGTLFNGPSGELSARVAERQEKPTNSVDSKRLKRKRKANSTELKDVLPGIPCESVKEKSREKLKVKKSKKGHEGKEKVKSKDKVHRPGCPKSEKGLRNNKLIQEIGNMSMISFISKDNKFYWEKVNSLSQRNFEDAEKMSAIYQCDETKERIEERSGPDKIDGHPINVRGEKECKERSSKPFLSTDHAGTRAYDKLLENNSLNSWNALKVLRRKKKDVKHMFMREMRLASNKAHLLANSTCEAHTIDSKQVSIEERMTLEEKRKQFENKQRPSIYDRLQFESEPKDQELTISGFTNGQMRKKKHSKRSHKPFCENFNKLTPLADWEEEQSNTAFFKHQNHGAATIASGKIGNSLNDYGKRREAASQFRQTEHFSTKVDVSNGANRKMLGKRIRKVEKQFKQTMWHYQETKSFWAFSV